MGLIFGILRYFIIKWHFFLLCLQKAELCCSYCSSKKDGLAIRDIEKTLRLLVFFGNYSTEHSVRFVSIHLWHGSAIFSFFKTSTLPCPYDWAFPRCAFCTYVSTSPTVVYLQLCEEKMTHVRSKAKYPAGESLIVLPRDTWGLRNMPKKRIGSSVVTTFTDFVTILPVQIVATFHEQIHRICNPLAGKYCTIVEF